MYTFSLFPPSFSGESFRSRLQRSSSSGWKEIFTVVLKPVKWWEHRKIIAGQRGQTHHHHHLKSELGASDLAPKPLPYLWHFYWWFVNFQTKKNCLLQWSSLWTASQELPLVMLYTYQCQITPVLRRARAHTHTHTHTHTHRLFFNPKCCPASHSLKTAWKKKCPNSPGLFLLFTVHPTLSSKEPSEDSLP